MSGKRRRIEASRRAAVKQGERQRRKSRKLVSERAIEQLRMGIDNIEVAIARAKAALKGVLALVVVRLEDGTIEIFFGKLLDDRHGHAVVSGGKLLYARPWGKRRPPWTRHKYQLQSFV